MMILLSCVSFAQDRILYRPTLTNPSTECDSSADRFLCQALLKGRELLEQQVNCEVIQTHIQKAWDGTLITDNPDKYQVRVEKGEESFRRIKNNGSLDDPVQHPRYQKIKIYSTASWYTVPLAIFTKSHFFEPVIGKDGITYKFYAPKALILEHTDIFTKKVLCDITGIVIFDRKSKLLTATKYSYVIKEKERAKHKFSYADEETIFGNPAGFEEVSPVPIYFVSKLKTSNAEVIIEVRYSEHKRFESDINFGTVSEIHDEEEETSHIKQLSDVNFRIVNKLNKKNTSNAIPIAKIKPVADSQIFSYLKDITHRIVVTYETPEGKRLYKQCTTFLYDKSVTKNEVRLSFLTNEHCLIGFVSGKLLNEHKDLQITNDNIHRLGNDIAVIRLTTTKKEWLELNTSFSFVKPALGDTLLSVGFGAGEYTESRGTIEGYNTNLVVDSEILVYDLFRVKLRSVLGASGSAGFNQYNEFIGLRFSGTNIEDGTLTKCGECEYSLFIDGQAVYSALRKNNLINR